MPELAVRAEPSEGETRRDSSGGSAARCVGEQESRKPLDMFTLRGERGMALNNAAGTCRRVDFSMHQIGNALAVDGDVEVCETAIRHIFDRLCWAP